MAGQQLEPGMQLPRRHQLRAECRLLAKLLVVAGGLLLSTAWACLLHQVPLPT